MSLRMFSNKQEGPYTYRHQDPVHMRKRWPLLQDVYDSKDDENFLYKTGVITKYTCAIAGGFAVMDVCLIPRPNPGLLNTLSRIKFYGLPLVGGGLAYISAVQMASNVRGGKSDQWNHMWGGMAYGAVIGKCSRCFITGTLSAMFLGFVGFILKDCAMYNMFPYLNAHKRYGGAFHHKYDFTMLPDRHGYWVRSEEEIPAMLERGQV